MNKNEFETRLKEMINSKVNAAFEVLKGMSNCEKLYNMMAAEGQAEMAQTFKNIVLCTIMLHPNITEKEIISNFYNRMKK